MWWPKPEELNDLKIEEANDGSFIFTADMETACGKWLSYYNSTEELRREFHDTFVKAILSFCKV